jgi:hypothetical protein
MTAMFIFVHHPHFLADLRCVCRSLVCKSVSCIITTSFMVISEYLYIMCINHFAVTLNAEGKCYSGK